MKYFKIILPFFLLFIFHCTQQPNAPQSDEPQLDGIGKISLNMDISSAPVEVVKMQGILSREGVDTVFFNFEMKDSIASALVENLAAGLWTLQVDAYNSDHLIIYTGKAQVNVQSGVITPVYLHLNPTTGSLEILVTWGDFTHGKILTMARNSENEWRMIAMDLNGRNFKDLGPGMYPLWTGQKDKITFLSNYTTFSQLDLKTNIKTDLNYLPYDANFIRYSESLDKILFDYKEYSSATIWHIGSVEPDGSDFQIVLKDSLKEKYPGTTRNEDWIYYHKIQDEKVKIYRIKPDGSQEEPFIFDNNNCEFPSFSYDNKKIVYSNYISEQYYAIVIRDIHSKEIVNTIDLTDMGFPTYPAFNKNGKYIVFSLIVGPNWDDRQLYRIRADGTELVQLTFGSDYKYYARPLLW